MIGAWVEAQMRWKHLIQSYEISYPNYMQDTKSSHLTFLNLCTLYLTRRLFTDYRLNMSPSHESIPHPDISLFPPLSYSSTSLLPLRNFCSLSFPSSNLPSSISVKDNARQNHSNPHSSFVAFVQNPTPHIPNFNSLYFSNSHLLPSRYICNISFLYHGNGQL